MNAGADRGGPGRTGADTGGLARTGASGWPPPAALAIITDRMIGL